MSDRFSSPPGGLSRNAVIVGGVVLFHVAALWALQSGLLQRAATVVIPVTILSPFIEPPKPKEVSPPPAPPPPPKAAAQPKVIKAPPPPRPVAIRSPVPAPDAPTGIIEPQPPAAPVMATPAPPAPPAPVLAPAHAVKPAVQLPATDAAYAQRCSPVYPSMSNRLGEKGMVVIKVLVGADGLPKQTRIGKSSGFDRLDQAAREALMRCRFAPGKVNGVAQAMEMDAPINFVLK